MITKRLPAASAITCFMARVGEVELFQALGSVSKLVALSQIYSNGAYTGSRGSEPNLEKLANILIIDPGKSVISNNHHTKVQISS